MQRRMGRRSRRRRRSRSKRRRRKSKRRRRRSKRRRRRRKKKEEAALVRLGKGRSRGLGDRGGRDRRQSREAPTLSSSSLEKSPNLL